MNKRILLVEPAYKTKFPPLGLMKLATYHQRKGDEVVFVKGRKSAPLDRYWDRVYITTLFTWTWNETVATIKHYAYSFSNYGGECFVGGILATLIPDDLFTDAGVQPVEGLLDDSAKIGMNDHVNIDQLAPDYGILDDVDFKYSFTDAFLGYTTKGCKRGCHFCAVKDLEPDWLPYIDIKENFWEVARESGEKQNLVLMDNNVLLSDKFDRIIDDIKELGFMKGAVFDETKRKRIIDFNQGLDARLLTEKKMARLAEIPLEPMRLAFDSIKDEKHYVKAVRLAHKYDQKNMSNYILYNCEDTPEDFYQRLRINIDLNTEFRNEGKTITEIYSFPMRFIPLKAKQRNVDTENEHWNNRYLRGVKVISNVLKGAVMCKEVFFFQAFGRDAEEFKAIISMPDQFILNRLIPDWGDSRGIENIEKRWAPYVKEWMDTYRDLSPKEVKYLLDILGPNDKTRIEKAYKGPSKQKSKSVRKLLEFHLKEKEIVAEYKTS